MTLEGAGDPIGGVGILYGAWGHPIRILTLYGCEAPHMDVGLSLQGFGMRGVPEGRAVPPMDVG